MIKFLIKKYNFKIIKHKFYYFSSLILIILMLFNVKLFLYNTSYDDGIFYNFTKQYSLLEFLKIRYLTWSGRLFSDLMSFISSIIGVWFYRFVSLFSIFLTSYSIISMIYKKFNLRYFLIFFLTFGLINTNILGSAVFWSIGAYNYLVPVAFGIYALSFYFSLFFRHKMKFSKFNLMSFFIAALLSIYGNEQISLILFGFAILYHTYSVLNKKKVLKISYVFTSYVIINILISFLSPGNKIRWESEILRYPEYVSFSFTSYLKIGISWIFDIIINRMFIMLMFLSSLPFILKNKIKSKYKPVWNMFFMQFIFVLANKIMDTPYKWIDYFYDFSFFQNICLESILSTFSRLKLNQLLTQLFPFVFWFVYVINLLILLINCSKEKLLTFWGFMAGIGSLVLMWFSPTIFVSGNRVAYVCSLSWIYIFIKILNDNNLFENNYLILIITIFSLSNLFSLYFFWLTTGFLVVY